MSVRMPESVTCHLCGFAFAPDQNACGGCAMHGGCTLIKCPNCGTETPDTNVGAAGWLQRVFARLRGDTFHA